MSKKVLVPVSVVMMLVMGLPLWAQQGSAHGGGFENELRAIADQCFRNSNAHLTGAASNKLQGFIAKGVQRLNKSGPTNQRKQQAKHDIARFATEMINKGQRQQNGSIRITG